MKLKYFSPVQLTRWFYCLGLILLGYMGVAAQGNSVVLVHADKNSGYGVAWGGPQNSPDMIVTALHLVAGKKAIMVVWQGKSSSATVEKIYKPSDLALLKLKTPLGIPSLGLYSGEPPWDTNINFWEIPPATVTPTKKTTVLDGKTSLANISPQIANEPAGLSKALCFDGTESYPGMKTSVINFKEVNIRKAHSGSPLTYGDKILGMVDGGAKLVDGKPCIWAIPASDFNKLYTLGTPPAFDMVTCTSPGSDSKYLYSGIRPDNPFLTEEEIDQAILLNTPLNFMSSIGTQLELHHNYTMTFGEVYSTLFEDEQQYLTTLFKPSETISLNDLLSKTVHFYSEDNTGVSIMIPDQCTLTSTTDAFGTLNTTTSPGGLITMSVYISAGKTMDDGMIAMNAFQQFLKPDDPNYKPIDQKLLKANNQYYNDYYEKKTKDSRGSIKSIFYANMTINQGNFLAVTINVPDWSAVANNPNEKLYFYLMEVCTVLSDFPVY
jgi:hypothetical protein